MLSVSEHGYVEEASLSPSCSAVTLLVKKQRPPNLSSFDFSTFLLLSLSLSPLPPERYITLSVDCRRRADWMSIWVEPILPQTLFADLVGSLLGPFLPSFLPPSFLSVSQTSGSATECSHRLLDIGINLTLVQASLSLSMHLCQRLWGSGLWLRASSVSLTPLSQCRLPERERERERERESDATETRWKPI